MITETLDAVEDFVTKAEAVLEANPAGENPDAIHKLKLLADAMLGAMGTGHVIDKACGSLMQEARTIYAPLARTDLDRGLAAHSARDALRAVRNVVLGIRKILSLPADDHPIEETGPV